MSVEQVKTAHTLSTSCLQTMLHNVTNEKLQFTLFINILMI